MSTCSKKNKKTQIFLLQSDGVVFFSVAFCCAAWRGIDLHCPFSSLTCSLDGLVEFFFTSFVAQPLRIDFALQFLCGCFQK